MSERSCRNCQYQRVCRAHIGQGKWLAEICSTYQHRCDRDALLALADEMDAYTKCDDERCGREMPPRVIHDFASRIREALGDCQRGVSGVGRRGASRGMSGQVAGVALVAPREGAGEKE